MINAKQSNEKKLIALCMHLLSKDNTIDIDITCKGYYWINNVVEEVIVKIDSFRNNYTHCCIVQTFH